LHFWVLFINIWVVAPRTGSGAGKLTKPQKFDQIAAALVASPQFGRHDALETTNLMKKWDRMKDSVQTRLALKKEGANLSNIGPNDLSETDKLVLVMLKEIRDKEDETQAANAKEEERNKRMLTHETKLLETMQRDGAAGGDTVI